MSLFSPFFSVLDQSSFVFHLYLVSFTFSYSIPTCMFFVQKTFLPYQRIQVVEFQKCSAYARLLGCDGRVPYTNIATRYVYNHVRKGLKVSAGNYAYNYNIICNKTMF